ncbi:MAG: hypothetical protein ACR2KI_03375 [Candidatus Limnocylindria bacterium]
MPDLLRRVAVLTVISGVGIGLLTPLAARSATPIPAETQRLLNAAASRPLSDAPRTTIAGRERSSAVSLAGAARSIQVEMLLPSAPRSTPGTVAMTARFEPVATPIPLPAPAAPPRSAAPAAAPPVAPPVAGNTIAGTASWYCCTIGYAGQAVVALPGALGGHYKPPPASRYVTICADRCARIAVVDYCACYWGTANQKVADLSPEAWAVITGRSRSMGVVRVTIQL